MFPSGVIPSRRRLAVAGIFPLPPTHCAEALEPPGPPVPPRRVITVERVRVASVQYFIRPVATFEAFRDQVEGLVDTAADHTCALMVFPEYFTMRLLTLGDIRRPIRDQPRRDPESLGHAVVIEWRNPGVTPAPAHRPVEPPAGVPTRSGDETS